jgi:aspartyl aminopeptidase
MTSFKEYSVPEPSLRVKQLLAFIESAPTPIHAVMAAKKHLLAAGFEQLKESDAWTLKPQGAYFVIRRDSSLVAWRMGNLPAYQTGIRLLGAHTDSPCLKAKPNPDQGVLGYGQVGVEVYGGVLLAPWFDRDLALAGRVSVVTAGGQTAEHVINIAAPVATIPSLAIHLDRSANEGRSINPEEQMRPILWQSEPAIDFKSWIQSWLNQQGHAVQQVLDCDLSFYDYQPGQVVGAQGEFIASARLDNLLSTYVCLDALIHSEGELTRLLVLNDHEEVGSRSTVGAAGNLLRNVLDRLTASPLERQQLERLSVMLSVDNAHGVHPNFAAKHAQGHGPLLNGGPVLKFDANQSYATQSVVSSRLRHLAAQHAVPLQTFVTRADMRCGSTIGPITATLTGIETLDIGLATFAMHSIRELAGAKDPDYLFTLLVAFLTTTQAFVNDDTLQP